jgi:nucleoside-diphosphate-sugar epimerase
MLINDHILITGANGFVGQHLSEALLAKGARVSQIFRSAPPDGHVTGTQHALDLTNSVKVAEVFSLLQPDTVIHLAGSKSRGHDVTQFRETYTANLLMSLNIIDACRALPNFKRLVFLGSCEEYGQIPAPYRETQREAPTSAYGLSKLAVTQILSALFHSQQFASVVLRPTVIYGPGKSDEMFLPALVQSLLVGKDFAMTTGEQRRDFIYIDDVVDAIIRAISADERVNGTIINIGAGISYQIKKIATLVANLINPDVNSLIKFGAVQYRPNEVMDYSVVIARAKELLDWYPSTNLKDGVQRTIIHFKKHINIQKPSFDV